jgi:ribose 5-phosphate isomerase B
MKQKIKKIYLSGDHAGFEIKEKIKPWLIKKGFKIEDIGPFNSNPEDDYPDYVIPMAKLVAKNPNNRGIIIAGSGQGEVIAANRIKNIRTALYYGSSPPEQILKLSRKHNNSNVLSLGAFFMDENLIKKAITVWIQTPFSNETRHKRRLKKIERLSKK